MNSLRALPHPGGYVARMCRYLLTGRPMYTDALVAADAEVGATKPNTSQLECVEIENIAVAPFCWRLLFTPLLKLPGVWVYLHGSQADGTTTSFSDYDDLVIIDLTLYREQKMLRRLIDALNQVDMRFCRLDPLQHHGHWILSKDELQHYSESFLPLTVLNRGLALKGPTDVTAHVDIGATRRELRRSIPIGCTHIRQLFDALDRNDINLYQLKGLVGSFALMPALVMQMLGQRIDKRTALAYSRDLYGHEAYRCIEWSTYWRDNWSVMENTREFSAFRLLLRPVNNPHLFRKLAHRLAPKARPATTSIRHLDRTAVEAFINETLDFVNTPPA